MSVSRSGSKGRHGKKPKRATSSVLKQINQNAAGIDVGATEHYVAVPDDRDEQPVQSFQAFTVDLHRLCDFLSTCDIDAVVMESTGVYWIPLFELLEQRGFDVLLVDARYIKHVPGRKSDVLDCQWLQQLHTFGLLRGAFRPDDQICVLRSYLRQRAMLVRLAGQHIQHMQKALTQMNIKLQHVVSDITGVTGLRIITAILDGQRDPKLLATYRDPRCRQDEQTIAKALEGNYRQEHLFELQQALELLCVYQDKIRVCDQKIEACLNDFDERADSPILETQKPKGAPGRNAPSFELRDLLYRMTGVDLTRIDGLEAYSVLKIISEIGLDMSRFPTVKHFCAWLSLCPGSKISGGKVLSSKSKASANRAAATLRLCAQTLYHSQSALGAYYRRMKARLGAPKAITATAHKIARILYAMLKQGSQYVDPGEDWYEQQYRDRLVNNLKRRAHQFGYNLIKNPELDSEELATTT